MNQVKEYFEQALLIADKGKVKRLFSSLGYRDFNKISVDMCLEALNDHGAAFSTPFGLLVKSAMATPKVESFINSHIINRIDGVTVPETATQPAVTAISGISSGKSSSSSGSDWLSGFSAVTNFLIQGASSASSLYNTIKGTGTTDSQTNLTLAQAKLAASTKPNWALIIGIAGVCVVIIVIAVFALKKGK